MATRIPQPIVHVYKEINIGKFKTVKHYELHGSAKSTELTKLINISKDRQCAKSAPSYWLQTHDGKKWIKPRLTGLFKTRYKGIYFGDSHKRKNLLVFKFSENAETLSIWVFKNHYTSNLSKILNLIS